MLRTIWINKWLIGFVTSIFLGLAGYYAFTATPLYTATATLVLDTQQDQVVDFQTVTSGLSSFAGDPAVVATEVEIMRSRSLIERVVDRLELEEDPEFNPELAPSGPAWMAYLSPRAMAKKAFVLIFGAPPTPADEPGSLLGNPDFLRREAVVQGLRASIYVENIPFSYVFTISATSEHPEKAATIANELAEVYILSQLDAKFEATQRATTWLSERVSELKVSLEQAEAAVENYSSSTTLVSEEALALSNIQLKDMRSRQSAEVLRAEELRARIEKVRSQRAEAGESGDLEGLARTLDDPRLVNYAIRVADAATDAARAPLIVAFDGLFDRNLARLETEVIRAEAQAKSLQDAVAEMEKRIEAQSVDLVQLRQLQREAEAAGLLYEYFLSRMKETSVQQGIQQPDSRVLSIATPPFNASWPSKTSIVLFAGVAGLFVGFSLVFVRELFQTTFRSPDQLEAATGVTVMGVLPSAPSTRRKSVLEHQMNKPTSELAEAVRNLRTSVLLSKLDHTPKVIMVSSSVPAESKTTTTLLLAHNSAMMGKRVLVIECDLRRRTFNSYFDVKGDAGLLSVLTGQKTFDEVVVHDDASGLDVLAGQRSSANAADVFASDRFAELIAETRERYDFVFIDTPPVLAVPDARVIAQHADAVLYVVKWDSTDRGAVASGLDLFAQANVKITGLALTRANPRKITRYGYSGYGYGYGSGASQRYYQK